MPRKIWLCVLVVLGFCFGPQPVEAQMNPYFAAINYPASKDTLMTMLLPDFQVAHSTNNFATFMGMTEYGITSNWTAGFMIEGQKIGGLPVTFGGVRFNTYYHLPHNRLMNLTVYGEYEDLNQAALYKMEVSGFGGEDLEGPLNAARHAPAHTFEQRAILYHDWGRLNLTFNFVSETNVQTWENDFGYVWGVFRQPRYMPMGRMTTMSATEMPGIDKSSKPALLSTKRLGYGLEMMGALGNTDQFGFDWHRQQHYVGPVFSYELPSNFGIRLEPAFGLSKVSDPFVLRLGLSYQFDHVGRAIKRLL